MISYVLGTEVLSDDMISNLLPQGNAAIDTGLPIDYFRISGSGRLIFGGLGHANPFSLEDVISILRTRMSAVFPQLSDIAIEHVWGGTMDVTYNGALHTAKYHKQLFVVNGWNGHGVAQSCWVGSVIARAIYGMTTIFVY